MVKLFFVVLIALFAECMCQTEEHVEPDGTIVRRTYHTSIHQYTTGQQAQPVKCPPREPCPQVEPVRCPVPEPVRCPVVAPVKCPVIVPPYVRPKFEDRNKLQSPRINNWGDWSQWEGCIDDGFVVGMKLSVQPFLSSNEDNTALNAIRFFCSSPGSSDLRQIVATNENIWGTWGNNFMCANNGYGIGFQLRSKENTKDGTDRTAANNLRLICEDGKVLTGNGGSEGDWTAEQRCPSGEALCGFRVAAEPYQGSGRVAKADDTAVNNIDMVCCKRK